MEHPLPELQLGKKWRSSGVPVKWLWEQFHQCPPGADEAIVNYHCRAWVLHMFCTILFPDGTGDTASWMYIPCLLNWDDAGNKSWGSAVLSFLYRQLCEACQWPSGMHTIMSECTTLLQVNQTCVSMNSSIVVCLTHFCNFADLDVGETSSWEAA